MIGTTIRHYRVLEKLGAGGMGVVYRAEDLALRRPVALKFLPPGILGDEERRARFQREARLAAALNHPNTCAVYEVGQVEAFDRWMAADEPVVPIGTPFIAMEFVEGETLAARLARSGRLPTREALDVAVQAAAGLAEAHAHRIVHRDLKPKNVMVTSAGRVKMLDFGLAKTFEAMRSADAMISTAEMISADLGDGNSVVGTVAYMSPEQALGKPVDSRSDVFAFGIMLYELVTGQRPFRGDTPTAIVAKILEADPEPVTSLAADIPSALGRIIRRCLQKKPDDRYQDTHDLVADLNRVRRRASTASLLTRWVWWSRWSTPGIDRSQRFKRLQLIPLVGVLILVVGPSYSLFRRLGDGRKMAASARSDQAVPKLNRTQAVGEKPTSDGLPAAAGSSHQPTSSLASRPPERLEKTPKAKTLDAAANDRARPDVPRGMAIPSAASALKARQSSPHGRLIVSSNPRASVTLDGDLVGVTPLTVETPRGAHEIVMASADGLRWRGKVDVAAGETIELHRELNTRGRLTVTSETWAEVSVDGGPPEQTPIHFSDIAAGLHELRAFREGYVSQRLELFVDEGNTTLIRLKLEKKP